MMSRISTRHVTTLEARHPTDSHWWGQLRLEPSGKDKVHVHAVGGHFGEEGARAASLPFVDLDELQELIDRAREQCASMGFVE